MEAWGGFFTAQVGASAALAGLIFVGVSLNLTKILSSSRLPDRALQALILLVAILLVASMMIIPGQPQILIGLEILIPGLLLSTAMTRLDLRIRRETDLQYRRAFLGNMVLTQLASLPYLIAGLMVLSLGLNGLYILPVGFLFSFVKAILDSWVLLVEINR